MRVQFSQLLEELCETRNHTEEFSKYLALIHTSHVWRARFISRIVVEFRHVMKLVFQPLLPLHSTNIKPLCECVLLNNMQCVLIIGRFCDSVDFNCKASRT